MSFVFQGRAINAIEFGRMALSKLASAQRYSGALSPNLKPVCTRAATLRGIWNPEAYPSHFITGSAPVALMIACAGYTPLRSETKA